MSYINPALSQQAPVGLQSDAESASLPHMSFTSTLQGFQGDAGLIGSPGPRGVTVSKI